MPFYHAIVRPSLLDRDQRERFAQSVVDVHCDVTGAPPSFVHALITEDPGGRLADGQNAMIAGTIRAGRNDAQKAEIAERMNAALAEEAGVSVDSVTTSTTDIAASHTMEGGQVLPEPGSAEEQEWMAV